MAKCLNDSGWSSVTRSTLTTPINELAQRPIRTKCMIEFNLIKYPSEVLTKMCKNTTSEQMIIFFGTGEIKTSFRYLELDLDDYPLNIKNTYRDTFLEQRPNCKIFSLDRQMGLIIIRLWLPTMEIRKPVIKNDKETNKQNSRSWQYIQYNQPRRWT